ncbi:protein-L-isoaspartate O-methyltransferase family protein [Falsigemmobacter intermedius]|uniref:protein-L-isoaspartate O-methyltransferase family protein n=1 Tax=Falsigemmobacter intermedius TaxID=1553448 RepID=UPI003F0C850C
MSDFAARRVMMVDNQVRPSDVTKYPVIAAMLDVPRESFVPDHLIEAAYMGENLVVAPGRVLLEPRTFAKLLDAVNIQKDELVLDVGSALGYSAAVIGRMAQAVVALEEDETMAAVAAQRLAAVDNVAPVTGALSAGVMAQAPFDVILIEGGVQEIPAALLAQLKEGGRIGALFMEAAVGVVRVGVKTGDAIAWRDAFNAAAPVLADFARKPEFAL